MAPMSSPGLVAARSYTTVAFSTAKLTFASATPSFLSRARSTRRTQEAHVIPVTGIVIVFSPCSPTAEAPLCAPFYPTPLFYYSDERCQDFGACLVRDSVVGPKEPEIGFPWRWEVADGLSFLCG